MSEIEVGDLVARISFDDTGLNKSMAEINRQMKLVESEFDKASSALKVYGSAEDALKAKSDSLTQQMSIQQQRINKLNESFQEAARTKGLDSKETQQLATQLNKAQAEYNKLDNELKQTNTELDKQATKVTKLGKDWNDAFDQTQQSIGNTFEATKRAGAAITAFGTGVTIGVGGLVKSAADFEQAMSNVKSVMSPKEVQKFGGELEKLAKQMGADTKYSAKEAAQGIEELVKAGVSVEQIMNGGLKGALSLAVAGQLELADAAEIASTALNAFRDDNLSVGQAADILAGAANASATSVGELKFGLSAVSAVSSAVGMSFDDTATALAAFAQNGLKGSDAGTSLKTMLMNLQPSTKAQIEEFERLDLTSYDVKKGLEVLRRNGIEPASESFDDVDKSLKKFATTMSGAKEGSEKAQSEYTKLIMQTGVMTSKFYDAAGSIRPMNQIAGVLRESLKDMTDAQRLASLEIMFGSDAIRAANILYKEGADGVNKMNAAMKEVTADQVAAERLNNLNGSLEQLKGSLETLAISLGTALLPAVKSISGWLENLVDGFNALSPEMQSTISIATATAGALALVAGPATMLVGFLPNIAAGFKMVSGSLSLLAGAAGPLALVAGGLALVTSTGLALNDYFSKDAIPTIERFGSTVSESTQKAVGAYMDLNDKAVKSLDQLSWSGQVVTKEMSDNITATFKQMGDQILDGMTDSHAKQLGSMQSFFNQSSALTDEEEAKIVEKMKEGQEERRKKVDEGQKRIAEILNKAKDEKRAITEQEMLEINTIQQKMADEAIRILSDNELEQKAIYERMHANANAISARQAADIVKNSLDQKSKVVKAAEQQATEAVKEIIRQRDEAKSISAEQAEALIKDAERLRSETVSKAEDMHTKVVAQAKLQATEHVEHVDWTTGEIKSKWDTFFIDQEKSWKDYFNFLGNIDLKGIGKNLIDGFINGFTSQDGVLRKSINRITDLIKGGIKDDLEIHSPSKVTTEYGENVSEGLAIGIENKSGKAEASAKKTAAAAAKAIKDNFDEAIKVADYQFKMGEVDISGYVTALEGVRTEYAKTAEQVRKVNLQINQAQMQVAKDSQKTFQQVYDENVRSLDRLGGAITTALKNRYAEEEKSITSSLQKQMDAHKQASQAIIKGYDAEYNAKLKTLDVETQIKLKAIQDQIDGINNQTSEEEKALDEQAYQKRLAEKNKELLEASTAEAREKTQNELNQMLAERERKSLLEQRQRQIEALRSEMERIKVQAQEKQTILQQELADKKAKEEEKAAAVQSSLSSQMDATKNHYASLTKEEALQAEARRLAVDKDNKELITLLNSYNGDWQNAGQSFGQSMLDGLNSMKASIEAAVSDILSTVQQVDLSNETDYLNDLLKNGTAGQKEWAINQAKQYGLSVIDGVIQGVRSNLSALASKALNSQAASTAKSGGSSGTTSFEGMFAGATFHVRNDNDIRRIAQELFAMQQNALRGAGAT